MGVRAKPWWLLLACGCHDPAPPNTVQETPTPLVRAVAELAHPRSEVRSRAESTLSGLAQAGLTLDQVTFLVRAAQRDWAQAEAPAVLLQTAANGHLGGDAVPLVQAAFPQLPLTAQNVALTWLTRIDDGEGAQALVEILPTLPLEGLPRLHLQALRDQPRQAELYFPALLARLDSADWFEVLHTALAYLQQEAVDPAVIARALPQLRRDWQRLRPLLQAAEAHPDWSWRNASDYASARADAALLLDTLGHLPGRISTRILEDGLSLRDPWLLLFAVSSSLALGRHVPAASIAAVGAWPESRGLLYERLLFQGQARLMPVAQRSQAALAESDLARWLVYPTELAQAPDEMELVQVESHPNAEGQPQDWYLFRFRVEAPHFAADRGWMAGIAGPFEPGDLGSAGQGTFSELLSWDELSADEHSSRLRAKSEPEASEQDEQEDGED